MLTCRICQCNCDPSDLINGVCDDCREEEQRETERKRQINIMLNATSFNQMEMEEICQPTKI